MFILLHKEGSLCERTACFQARSQSEAKGGTSTVEFEKKNQFINNNVSFLRLFRVNTKQWQQYIVPKSTYQFSGMNISNIMVL